MRCVTYNIQYGFGLDGRFDLDRIAASVDGADVIALQEVSRNHPENDSGDLVAALRALLPGYFAVFGSPFKVDAGSRLEDGRVVDRYFEFGNMILSRTPILAARTLTLPRRRSYGRLNMQRCAVEALIATGLGPLRFYSVHLDHLRADERIEQIRFLVERATRYLLEGGALTGVGQHDFPEPPHPEGFVLMGDFNMVPGSPEYRAMTGVPDYEIGIPLSAAFPADAALHAGDDATTATWVDARAPDDAGRMMRLDYMFVQAGLVPHLRAFSVDGAAAGSDHRPVWMELG